MTARQKPRRRLPRLVRTVVISGGSPSGRVRVKVNGEIFYDGTSYVRARLIYNAAHTRLTQGSQPS